MLFLRTTPQPDVQKAPMTSLRACACRTLNRLRSSSNCANASKSWRRVWPRTATTAVSRRPPIHRSTTPRRARSASRAGASAAGRKAIAGNSPLGRRPRAPGHHPPDGNVRLRALSCRHCDRSARRAGRDHDLCGQHPSRRDGGGRETGRTRAGDRQHPWCRHRWPMPTKPVSA